MQSSVRPSQLEAFPVVLGIPVQWGELDAYGHVNNSVFFRYFESVRMVYLERCGFIESYNVDKIGAILRSTECTFRQPLYHPDDVIVGARVTALDEDRFAMAYVAVSVNTGQTVAEASAVVVSFDYENLTKAPLPIAVREGVRALESEWQHQERHHG
ncbi:MAG: acyl-CoA thioesterase [Gemmatimonadota bacterium]|nr:MAG: acyl-CoA thioesterase [Gemmatimonadota bacterium]